MIIGAGIRQGVKAYKNHQEKKAHEAAAAGGTPNSAAPLAEDNTKFAQGQGQGQPQYHSTMAQQQQYRDAAPQDQTYYAPPPQQPARYEQQQGALTPAMDTHRRSSNAGSEDERIMQAQAHAQNYGDAPGPDYIQGSGKPSHNPFTEGLEKHGVNGPQ